MHMGYSVFKCDGKRCHPDDLEVLVLREEKNGRAYSEPPGLGLAIFLLCSHSFLCPNYIRVTFAVSTALT